ncbi:NADH-quinone oxidoreductase subunit J [candidate division KSB1 bacterium]|nr:NADH-quinone oxidoreductase subunit J [candidate division KSB1 bacterium]NIR70755.1 NADH-quinone oxidoreductase subunit J [candidate division KSB1 bacterium]NIS23208.1 NADH-quinone oxidoreductase subunit J [candidate division KSB1 bacterium]NIT70068.1 NADH-quinone oxidoreductase subunit J [candidate division KSB1 bacterium]NIU23705.1 NADH-quinone oxidoreductase subunit J [candidate division KSB1 bacterium]
MNTVFYISGAVAILATLMVITRLNAIHALLYLIVSLLAVAVAFFTLGAPFVAALEVIIYAGAIMVLFIFVIMMLNLGQAATEQERKWLSPTMWIGPGILALILAIELVYLFSSGELGTNGRDMVAVKAVPPREVGASLFSTYLLGAELAGMLLLAGLVGAFHLGRRSEGE